MKTILVEQYDPSYVPVKGKVTVRLSLGLKDNAPSLETAKHRFARRSIEAEAFSPTLKDLEDAAKFWRNKYNKGTTHTFFETIEIKKEGRKTILDLGFGS